MIRLIINTFALIGLGTAILMALTTLSPIDALIKHKYGNMSEWEGKYAIMRVASVGDMEQVKHDDGSVTMEARIGLADWRGIHYSVTGFGEDFDNDLLTEGDHVTVSIRERGNPLQGTHEIDFVILENVVPDEYFTTVNQEYLNAK